MRSNREGSLQEVSDLSKPLQAVMCLHTYTQEKTKFKYREYNYTGIAAPTYVMKPRMSLLACLTVSTWRPL